MIDPPPIMPGATGEPVRIGTVVDARVFSKQSFAAPVPSTRGDADDPAWTRRVFGRQLAATGTLGADRFTLDPAGVPELVRAALTAGLSQAGRPTLAADAADSTEAPHLDLVIEDFWLHEATRSSSARIIHGAEVVVTGNLEGFAEPVRLHAQGSVLSGAADGVLWRNAMARTLEELARSMADAVSAAARTGTDTEAVRSEQ